MNPFMVCSSSRTARSSPATRATSPTFFAKAKRSRGSSRDLEAPRGRGSDRCDGEICLSRASSIRTRTSICRSWARSRRTLTRRRARRRWSAGRRRFSKWSARRATMSAAEGFRALAGTGGRQIGLRLHLSHGRDAVRRGERRATARDRRGAASPRSRFSSPTKARSGSTTRSCITR